MFPQPSTKAEAGEHDLPITVKEMENMLGKELAARIEAVSIAVYKRAEQIADRRASSSPTRRWSSAW